MTVQRTGHCITLESREHPITKVVFPAAGLGTRFLPATKALPKEMLPLVDKPLIQYGVEEAIASGFTDVVIVTGRGKTAIEDHFDVSFELEHLLEAQHNDKLLAKVQAISDMFEVAYVRQKEALGLGHAVLRAKSLVREETFAVVLADDVIISGKPCLAQLRSVYEWSGQPVIALMEVDVEKIPAYGIVSGERVTDFPGTQPVYRIHDLVEKPNANEALSRLAIIGRYILTSDIFFCLENIQAGSGGEIQLTDGLRALATKRPLYGICFEGKRFDAGDKLGFLEATVEIALSREDLSTRFRQYLKRLQL